MWRQVATLSVPGVLELHSMSIGTVKVTSKFRGRTCTLKTVILIEDYTVSQGTRSVPARKENRERMWTQSHDLSEKFKEKWKGGGGGQEKGGHHVEAPTKLRWKLFFLCLAFIALEVMIMTSQINYASVYIKIRIASRKEENAQFSFLFPPTTH
jgi:hypothetical protein